jgi:probable F420-dependent oxidoreductase
MHPGMFVEAATSADSLGFESVWLPEHLILPVDMSGSPFEGVEHPPVPPSTPVFDSLAFLSYLAGCTKRVRLGTHVYNLALRHPFVAARSVQTADVVSGGRIELGVGAGWLRQEWDAAGLDFDTRGPRLDEALEVCRRLWTDDHIEYHGRFFDFDPVMFEPKPTQQPHPPVLIGGESPAALRRAAQHDGWIGLDHTPDSATAAVARLHELRRAAGHEGRPFTVTVGGNVRGAADVDAFEAAGVDRLIVGPWARTRDVPEALAAFAHTFLA